MWPRMTVTKMLPCLNVGSFPNVRSAPSWEFLAYIVTADVCWYHMFLSFEYNSPWLRAPSCTDFCTSEGHHISWVELLFWCVEQSCTRFKLQFLFVKITLHYAVQFSLLTQTEKVQIEDFPISIFNYYAPFYSFEFCLRMLKYWKFTKNIKIYCC